MKTNQLPPHTITIRDHPEPHIMQWSDLELAAVKRYAEQYALQARAQVQGEPVYQICKKDSQSISSAWIDVEKQAYEDAGIYPEYGCRTLYTRPAPSVPMTERELELIDGMIAVQLDHAQRCDAISNRAMAEKQKGWDMERVELLRRIRSLGITAQATQVEMTDDVVRDAERYRYLRDIKRRDSIVLSGPEAGVWCDAEDEDGTLLLLTEDDLDEAIDAAMLAAKEGTNGEIN